MVWGGELARGERQPGQIWPAALTRAAGFKKPNENLSALRERLQHRHPPRVKIHFDARPMRCQMLLREQRAGHHRLSLKGWQSFPSRRGEVTLRSRQLGLTGLAVQRKIVERFQVGSGNHSLDLGGVSGGRCNGRAVPG